MCQAYRRQYEADFISVMPTNVFGPGDNYHPENAHVVAALIRRLIAFASIGLSFEMRDEIFPTDIWNSANGRGSRRAVNRGRGGAAVGALGSGRLPRLRKASTGLPRGTGNFMHRIDRKILLWRAETR